MKEKKEKKKKGNISCSRQVKPSQANPRQKNKRKKKSKMPSAQGKGNEKGSKLKAQKGISKNKARRGK